jgi:hypothetical protein
MQASLLWFAFWTLCYTVYTHEYIGLRGLRGLDSGVGSTIHRNLRTIQRHLVTAPPGKASFGLSPARVACAKGLVLLLWSSAVISPYARRIRQVRQESASMRQEVRNFRIE